LLDKAAIVVDPLTLVRFAPYHPAPMSRRFRKLAGGLVLLLLLPVPLAGIAADPEDAGPSATAEAGRAALPPDSALSPMGLKAELPPVPRMLDDPDIASPFTRPPIALPYIQDALTADTGDEPLWVLPQEAIPEHTGGIPGARMSRERGYLDSPETIHGAGRRDGGAAAARLHADLDWEYCGPRPARLGPPSMAADPGPTTPIDVDAGGLTYNEDTELLELRGGFDLRRGSQRVMADTATYNRRTGDVLTSGETYLEYPGVRILGSGAAVNLESDSGRIPDAHYRFSGSANLRGDASLAELVNPDLTRYSQLTFTSCPPGNNAWSLRASSLELDQVSGRGTARNARLRIKGLPILYTPYLNFPIDDRRKSGFLIPSFGNSDNNGSELILPYYWNIAPNMDATFFPRYMSERGLMLGGELRWLTSMDEGKIQAEVIDDSERESGGTRWALHVEQDGRYFERWRTRLDYNAVSDDEYLEDFGGNLDTTSNRRLLQRGEIAYSGNGWSLLSRAEAFQTVDPAIPPAGRPYGRLPQVLFRLQPKPFGPGLLGGLDAEYDYFDHNHRVHGQRIALRPTLNWPLRRSYGHLIPSASVQAASYSLVDTDADRPSDPGHVIPTFDLDGKLVLERQIGWLGDEALQTIEPRLYYLYTPFRDQSDTPVFDSTELTFGFSNLFRSNRFTGRDRIGDANQLTTALTSRTLKAATGEELFRLSVGQIFYFANRRVQIQGPEETATTSPYTGELSALLMDNWTGRASFEWDPKEDDDPWGRRSVQIQYHSPDNLRLLNLAYRFDQGTSEATRYEDTDVSLRLPVGNHVELVGRWLYSLLDDRTTEAFAGIEFGQCCWKLRILGRHFKSSPEDAGTNSVMLQLELAGLGSFGSSVSSFLQEEIYGYQVD
jgi:LPS-assembly protein